MNKRLFRVVLILVIAVILFAGCNNFIPPTEDPTTPAEDPTTPAEDPTTLEGTWRGLQFDAIYTYIKDEQELRTEEQHETYPREEPLSKTFTEMELPEDFIETNHPYQQIEDKFRFINKHRYQNIPEDLGLPLEDFFIQVGEADYTVKGEKIILTFEGQKPQEMTYSITGNTLTIDLIYISPKSIIPKDWDYYIEESVSLYTKVPDSEIGAFISAEDLEKYPDLVTFHPELKFY